MSTGYEAGGYGLVNLDGSLTERSRRAGETARTIAANADLILSASPQPAEVAVVFNPLVPLLGGEQAYGDRRAMHRAVAGYHRMFFERNVPVDFPSARELDAAALARYKLVIVPYPILLTAQMAKALEEYAAAGGRLFVEARPGWQDERGHAEPILPGFGWHEMIGVRETEVLPVKEVEVRWGDRRFPGTSFAERFQRLDPAARVVATFADGQPAAYERTHGKGKALLLGTFADERNQQQPIAMHPLADALIDWAGIARPAMQSSAFVELRRMTGPQADFVFLFNHGAAPAQVALSLPLASAPAAVRELATGEAVSPTGRAFTLESTVPAQSVRVYRLDH
jgi:beta-galactosidase